MLKWLLALLFFISSLNIESAMATSRNAQAGAIFLTSYYRVNKSTKHIEACLVSPLTLAPLIIGCAPIAPPLEKPVMPSSLIEYTNNTRCQYLVSPRYDLKNLGSYLATMEYSGSASGNMISIASGKASPQYPAYDAQYIINFLKSDLHVVSTIVGCIQDMVVNIFSEPSAQQLSVGDTRPFLGAVQDNMRPFVMATLSLYVALVGVKIMTSAGSLRRGEYIMFLIKFAFVMYMNTTGMWVASAGDTSSLNLLPALIYGSDYLISMFTSALNTNDPIGMCSYIYNGAELLNEQYVALPSATSGAITTLNTDSGIHVTIWDLIDCKLAGYISFGSCHYNGAGILSVFMMGLAVAFMANFLFAIVTIAYIYLTITMALKFARVTILCSIVLATLVLVSPLFSCFLLFDKTASMFKDWAKAILGYMMYPALLMAYFTLMMISIDSIYYGSLDIVHANTTITSGSSTGASTRIAILQNACEKNKSLFCSTVKMLGDPCASNTASFYKTYGYQFSVYSNVKGYTIRYSVILKYLLPLVEMTLVSLLFYLLMDSSISLITMLTSVVGVDKVAETGFVSYMFNSLKAYIQKRMGEG